MTTKNMKVQLRRDTASNWTTKNPVLLSGEMGIESDTNKFKFGDGNKTWTQLDYASADSSEAVWGGITGTLSEQTDLNTELGKKLESTNIIQGENITLTKVGNNITINASGEISGGVEWGNITGDINNQTDLNTELNGIKSSLEPITSLEQTSTIKTETANVNPPTGLSPGWFLNNKMTPGSRGGLLKGLYTVQARSQSAEALVELAIVEVDFDNNKWTTVKLIPEKVNFQTGTQALLSNPVWIEANQYVMVKTPDTNFGYLNNGSAFKTISWLDTPEVGVEKNFYSGQYVGLGITLGLIFEEKVSSALDDVETIAGLFKEVKVEDIINNPGTLKTNTGVTYISNKYKVPHNGKIIKIKIPDNTYTENKNVSFAICSYNETSKIFTVKSQPYTFTITPETTEFVLDTPWDVKENDYIGINGPVGFTNPETPYKSYISAGGWSTLGPSFSGEMNRGEVPDGFNFEEEYIHFINPNEEVEKLRGEIGVLSDKVDECNDNTVVKKSSYLGNVSGEKAGSTWSVGAWCVGRFDAAPSDGKITKVEFTTSVDASQTVFVGAFSKNSDNTKATLERYVKATLPANEKVIVLNTPLEIHEGEVVGTNVGQTAIRTYKGQGGNGYFTGGDANTKDPQTIGQTINFLSSWANALVDVRFTIETTTGVSEYAQENRQMINDIINSGGKASVSINDMNKVLLVGSSLTAAYYTIRSSTWVERVNDMVDVNIINGGISGNTLTTNMNKLISNAANYGGAPHARDIKPTYIMWDDSANGTETGEAGLIKYRQMKEVVDSYGAKLLMGSEENWSNAFNSYEHTQQAFANEVGVPYSPTGRLNQWLYPRVNGQTTPYPCNSGGHGSYRSITSYIAHADLLGALPIKKNVKMFRPRETYKDGNPEITDLAYDTNMQRLRYWTAISPGASSGGWLTGHLDNYDKGDTSLDVPGTTVQGGSASEETKMWLGTDLQFTKYALIEFILDKVNITKGTFKVECNKVPTKVYIASAINTNETYTDGYIRSNFVELPFTATSSGEVIASFEDDTLYQYELYDKVRIVVYYADGAFILRKPEFYDYDGIEKKYDETINYHRRKFGTEMLDVCNPSDSSWGKASGAQAGSLPEPIANYTLYNDTKSHAELTTDGSKLTKTVNITNPGYKKVAVRVIGQNWSKISTIRFNGTEYENSPYISNTKDDPLSLAAYKATDYDYGMIRVTINDYISKDLLVLPGWYENYFEVDLTPEDTTLRIKIEKKSFVDNSYVNADKPIFIHHVSVQEIE